MRQSILIFFIIFYFLKLQANDSLKGGAGIKQNGQVKTFYSAQIHILPESELLQNIPSWAKWKWRPSTSQSLSQSAETQQTSCVRSQLETKWLGDCCRR